jgi:hypothetical protein
VGTLIPLLKPLAVADIAVDMMDNASALPTAHSDNKNERRLFENGQNHQADFTKKLKIISIGPRHDLHVSDEIIWTDRINHVGVAPADVPVAPP